MTTFYVILEQGVDYNDETHSIGGEARVDQNGFDNIKDALAEAKKKLKDRLQSFCISDFEYDGNWDAANAWAESKGINHWDYTAKWSDMIADFEAAGKEWVHLVPALYIIQGITV